MNRVASVDAVNGDKMHKWCLRCPFSNGPLQYRITAPNIREQLLDPTMYDGYKIFYDSIGKM